MALDGSCWNWLEVAGKFLQGLELVVMAENDLNWWEIARNDWTQQEWLETDRKCWNLVKVAAKIIKMLHKGPHQQGCYAISGYI